MENKEEKLQQALAKHKSLAGSEPVEDHKPQESEEFSRIEKPGVFGAFIGFIKVRLLGMSDPVYEKYTLLKTVLADLRSLPIQMYNPRNGSVTKNFGKIIFELYRYTQPLKELINIQGSKLALAKTKDFFVFYFMNEKQKSLYESLTGEGIKKILNSEGMKNSTKIINEYYKELQKSFEKEIIRKINLNFSVMFSLDELIRFDLYPLVKKFCPGMQEGDITEPPAFKDVDGIQVIELIKDLCYVLYSLNTTYDMREAFKILGEMKGATIISDEDIKNFQALVRKIISDDYLTSLIRIIEENPFYRPIYNFVEHNILNDFFTELSTDIKNSRDHLVDNLKRDKINQILNRLFNTTQFETLKFYNLEKSDILYKKGVKSFTFCEPLNYLKMFLKEIYNRYIMDSTNRLLIEGNYIDKHFNQKLSQAFLEANSFMDDIRRFDEEEIGSDKTWGRIKGLLPNVMREQKLLVLVNKEIEEMNYTAEAIVQKAAQTFSVLLSCIKSIVEEYKTNSQDILANVKTIGGSANENKIFIESLVRAYNDIQAIYALLKFMTG